MDEPGRSRELEEWAGRASDDCDHVEMEGVCEPCLVEALRAYAEQKIMRAQFYCGHEGTLLEYANEVSSLRIERDALLVVAQALENLCEQSQYQMDRLHQELQERPNYKDVTWDYANDLVVRIKAAVKASIHDAEVPLNHPDVQRLVKEDL